MTREQIDKIEATITAIIAVAVIAFAGFTPEEGAVATDLVSQIGAWVFGGYGIFKSIVEFVKSQTKQ
jgi:hypothetical protein